MEEFQVYIVHSHDLMGKNILFFTGRELFCGLSQETVRILNI